MSSKTIRAKFCTRAQGGKAETWTHKRKPRACLAKAATPAVYEWVIVIILFCTRQTFNNSDISCVVFWGYTYLFMITNYTKDILRNYIDWNCLQTYFDKINITWTSSSLRIGMDFTLNFCLNSFERGDDISTRLMCEGALKCLFLFFLLEEVTCLLYFILPLAAEKQSTTFYFTDSKH